MIRQLNVPPVVPDLVVDSTGTIYFDREMSGVSVHGGTLEYTEFIPGGTLVAESTVIDPNGILDWTQYASRDQQLLGRDQVVAAAIVRVSSSVATIFGCKVDRPTMTELSTCILPDSPVDRQVIVNQHGTVDHVIPSDVPYAEVAADKDLYGRDLLLHEALVRFSEVMVNPPLITADVSGTAVGTISDAWSLGEAIPTASDVQLALRLDVNLFKKPDQQLAFQDNSLGVFVANVGQVLENPFVSAERVVLNVSQYGVTILEDDTYIHDSDQDTATTRVFVTEPQLDGRLKLSYDLETFKLRWYPLDSNVIHIPQIQPFFTGGTLMAGPQNEVIEFVVDVPQRQDSAFFSQKAGLIVANDEALVSILLSSGAYVAGIDQDGLVQNVQLTLSNSVLLFSIPDLVAGEVIMGLTLIPQSFFEMLGCQFLQLESTSDSGGLFPQGTSTTADYTLNVLPGNYQLEIAYTNFGGDTPTDFPILVTIGDAIISSNPLVFGSDGFEDGDIVIAAFNVLSVGVSSLLSITWEGLPAETNQLKILSVRLKSSDITPLSMKLSASLMSGNSVVDTTTFEFNGYRDRPDVAAMKFSVGSPTSNTSVVLSLVNNTNLTALAINQVQFAYKESIDRTPNASGFDSFPMLMLDRAFKSVLDSFNATRDYVDPRQESGAVYVWNPSCTASWLSQLEFVEKRLLTAFRLGGPLDVGRPALVPNGLEYVLTTSSSGLSPGTIWAKSDDTRPQLVAAKPWILTQRFLVANDTFLGFGD